MFYLLTDFCKPAKLYAFIAFLSLLYFIIINDNMVWFIVKAVLFIGWTFLLQRLCKSGINMIAWLLAIVPHILFLLVTVKRTE